MSLDLSLGLRLGAMSGAGSGAIAASLFANDAQGFWLQRANAVQSGGALVVTSCSGTQSSGQMEAHIVSGGIRKTIWLGSRVGGTDDHDNPSVSILPDGRAMFMLSAHTEASGTYYAITKNPLPNIGGLGRTFLVPKAAGTGNSYHTTIHLEGGQTVLFRRENIDGVSPSDRREQGYARINTADLESVDNPTWTLQRLFKRDSARPYALYVKWGGVPNRVFVVASNGHPGEVNTACSLHSFTMDFTAGAPVVSNMDGTPILSAQPFNLTDATLIKDQPVAGTGMMWPHDVVIGPDGFPWILFSRHPTPVTGVDGRTINAEYWFGRWNGTAWITHQISSNNRTPLLVQPRYVPGLCFDQNNPRKLFLSESNGDNIPEIREYDFDEVTGVKTLVRNVGTHGNGREKIRLFSPVGASPSTRLIFSEVQSYADITNFEMHMFADGLSITPDSFSGPLDAATVALIARMTVPPDATWEARYDWLIRRLKVGGLNGTDNWSDAGALYSLIAHDAQVARLDWKGGADITVVAGTTGPVFTAGVGYRGINNTTDYLQLPAPNAISGLTQNSAHAGAVWNAGLGNVALQRIAGGSPILAASATLRINEAAGLTRNLATNTATSNERQFTLNNRSGAAATQYYMDGALMKSGTGASTSPDSAPLVLGYSSTVMNEAVTLGGSKTLAQVQDLTYALAGFRRLVQSRLAP